VVKVQNRTSESTKLTSGEKLTGVAIAAGTGLVTAVGVVLPILEFIVGGVGGVTGLGITLSGLGSILTISLGGLLAFAVGGLAAYMAYKSYAETAKELKKEIEEEELLEKKAQKNLRNQIREYLTAIMNLYMMENCMDVAIDKDKLSKLVAENMPNAIEERPLARENLKKLFNMVLDKVSTAPIKYSLLLNSFRGINPSNTDVQKELAEQQGEMKKVVKNYFTSHYNQDIKPKRANPSYLLEGLLGGLTGFVGVLGISSSITTIAMGFSFSLAFGFLSTNPVGWGIIGLAVVAGVAAGVTYGYLQYKNAQRKEVVKLKQHKVSKLDEECKLLSEKTAEIKTRLEVKAGVRQEAEKSLSATALTLRGLVNETSADLQNQVMKREKTRTDALRLENAEVREENVELKREIAMLRRQLQETKNMSAPGAFGVFGQTKTADSATSTVSAIHVASM